MAQVAARVEGDLTATVDAGGIVASHPGPACLFGRRRNPLLANATWLALGLPDPRSNRPLRLPGRLAVDLLAAAETGGVQVSTLRVVAPDRVEGAAGAIVQFTILPVEIEGETALLALGEDRTIVETLQSALSESREFHRSFACCSADFIWQVDASGVIDYVGPRGLLDYTPDEIFGVPISRFYTDANEGEASLVFMSREPVWEYEVWLSDKNGDSHCFLVSSVPVRDGLGRWRGARGIGREVTDQRAREAELKRARRAQRMIESVLHAMRSEVDPRAILDAATVVAVDSARLDACLVARPGAGGRVEWVAMAIPDPRLKLAYPDLSRTLLASMAEVIASGGSRLRRLASKPAHFLIAPTVVNGTANGAIAFGRASDPVSGAPKEGWSQEDEHVLRAMADQMGVSLAQFELVESLRQEQRPADAD